MSDAFLPTAIKFHYQWNLRELSAVTQGLCLATPDYYNQPLTLARLWLHEVRTRRPATLSYLTTLHKIADPKIRMLFFTMLAMIFIDI